MFRSYIFRASSLFAILGLSIFWRFYNLDYRCLWYDEVEVIQVAQRAHLADVISGAKDHISAPPVDYILRHFWQMIGGIGDKWVRAYSGVFGVFSVLLTFLVGQKLFGNRVGLLSSIFLALSSFHVFYSAEVKFYSLLVAGYLAILYLWLLAMERQSIWRWIVYGLVGLSAVYVHPYAMFALFFCFFSSLLQWFVGAIKKYPELRANSQLTHVSVTSLVIFLFYLPWVFWDFVGQEQGWAPPEFSWEFFHSIILDFSPGGFIIGIILVTGIMIYTFRLILTREFQTLPLWMTVFIAPFLVYLLDIFGHYPLLEKQLIFIQPSFLLLGSGGLVTLLEYASQMSSRSHIINSTILDAAFFSVALVAIALSYPQLRTEKNPDNWQQDNWRSVIQTISEQMDDTDYIFWATHDNISSTVIQWYIKQNDLVQHSLELFEWWQPEVLKPENLIKFGKESKYGKVWLFGTEFDRLFDDLGIKDNLTKTIVGNVNVYQIRDLRTWNYDLVSVDKPISLSRDSSFSKRIFLIDGYTYLLNILFEMDSSSSQSIRILLDGEEIKGTKSAHSSSQESVNFYLRPEKTGEHILIIESISSASQVIREIRVDPIRNIGLSTPYEAEVWDMKLFGEAQTTTDANLRTLVWEYRTGDLAEVTVWVNDVGLYQLSINGASWGPPPAIMSIYLDDRFMDEAIFYSEWDVVSSFIDIPVGGAHKVSFIFSNDYSGSEGDRNLLIDWVAFSKIPALLFEPSNLKIASLERSQGVNQSNGKLSIDIFAKEEKSLLAEYSVDQPDISDAEISLDGEDINLVNVSENTSVLGGIVGIDQIGKHTLVIDSHRPDATYDYFVLKPFVGMDHDFTEKSISLDFPSENQIVFFDQPGIIRYSNGEIVSAKLWFSDAGQYEITVDAYNSVPAPVEIQIVVDKRIAGSVQFNEGDNSRDRRSLIFSVLSEGFHLLELRFANDYFGPEGDRNAIVSQMEIKWLDRLSNIDHSKSLDLEKLAANYHDGVSLNNGQLEMFWAGEASARYSFDPGNYSFQVGASGQQGCGIWPMLKLSVDGKEIGERLVADTKERIYEFSDIKIDEWGDHQIDVEFTQPAVCDIPGQDVNLIIQSLNVKYQPPK